MTKIEKNITDVSQKLVGIVQYARNGGWMTSLDVNKATPKENLVVGTTITTCHQLANGESSKDDTMYENFHISAVKSKNYYSSIINTFNQKYAKAFTIISPVIRCNSDTNIHR